MHNKNLEQAIIFFVRLFFLVCRLCFAFASLTFQIGIFVVVFSSIFQLYIDNHSMAAAETERVLLRTAHTEKIGSFGIDSSHVTQLQKKRQSINNNNKMKTGTKDAMMILMPKKNPTKNSSQFIKLHGERRNRSAYRLSNSLTKKTTYKEKFNAEMKEKNHSVV